VVLLCNPHVTKEAALFGSFEGALLERGHKTLLADLSQSLEAGSEGQGGGSKGWFTRRVCPQVEGTDVQAIVAAEDAIAHLSSELVRDGLSAAAQFDCQVGDTESGIDEIGFDDGAGRTSLNTEGTASAQICARFIRL
jgi:hypothetical protein